MRLFQKLGAGRAWAVVALLALMAAPATAQEGRGADSFSSNGDEIAGWHWLRDGALSHAAEFTFDDPPETGDIVLDIHALATDQRSGGRGVAARFDLLVGFPGSGNMGGVFERIRVELPNVSPPDDPVGYHTRGQVVIPRETLERVVPGTDRLFIRIVRSSPADPHVAFRADSVQLSVRGGADPSEAEPRIGEAEPDAVPDGTAVTGEGLLPESFSSNAPEIAGWHWLRRDDHVADYIFEGAPVTGDLVLEIHALASGGLAARFDLLIGFPGAMGDRFHLIEVVLPNVSDSDDPLGLRTRGRIILERALLQRFFDRSGRITIRLQRRDPADPDIALRRDSLRLYRRGDGPRIGEPSGGTAVLKDLGPAGDEAVTDAGAAARDSFRSNGEPARGWYWLRDPGLTHAAEYVFARPPAEGDMILEIDARAGDRPDPGAPVRLELLVGFPGSGSDGRVLQRLRVELPRLAPAQDGEGSRASGRVILPREVSGPAVPRGGGLFVRIVRQSAQDAPVAFRADSLSLYGALMPGAE